MKRAIFLLIGAGAYVFFLQWQSDVAQDKLSGVENFYTSAANQAQGMTAANR
jgi:hypothetical protein